MAYNLGEQVSEIKANKVPAIIYIATMCVILVGYFFLKGETHLTVGIIIGVVFLVAVIALFIRNLSQTRIVLYENGLTANAPPLVLSVVIPYSHIARFEWGRAHSKIPLPMFKPECCHIIGKNGKILVELRKPLFVDLKGQLDDLEEQLGLSAGDEGQDDRGEWG